MRGNEGSVQRRFVVARNCSTESPTGNRSPVFSAQTKGEKLRASSFARTRAPLETMNNRGLGIEAM